MMATTVPTTVENWGRLTAYTWGDISSRTWGNINSTPYTIKNAFTASLNSANYVKNFADALNTKLEQSDMFSLSELTVLFNSMESTVTNFNNALG